MDMQLRSMITVAVTGRWIAFDIPGTGTASVRRHRVGWLAGRPRRDARADAR